LIREIKKFIQRRNQKAKPILNGDDFDIISSLIDNNPKENYILCGLDSRNDYQVIGSKTTWKENTFCNDFTLKCPDGTLVQTWIPMPGEKNAIDAVMALAMCVQLGGDLQKSIQGLPHLPTMDRRFEICRSNQTTIVIDDEGDSPEVIKTVLQNCKEWFPQKKLIAVLQPHRYSRLKSLFDDYVEVMSIADEVILLPVYSAGEKEIVGINSETLMNSIVNQGFLKQNIHSLSREEACSFLRNKLMQNYAIITLGPGDVWKVAESLAKN
jgi:UDP-N-acetylmuramate--alanine ligase